jgi:Protein of Unknown function (DUF2784)
MLYGIAADSVVVIHFLWILFLIFGGFWGRKKMTVKLIHVPAIAFACLVEIYDWYCPLTHLEVWLRERQHAGYGYGGSFIAHYLEKLIYISLPRPVIIGLALLLAIGNALLYIRARNDQRRV